jgi:hypothetical protein
MHMNTVSLTLYWTLSDDQVVKLVGLRAVVDGLVAGSVLLAVDRGLKEK